MEIKMLWKCPIRGLGDRVSSQTLLQVFKSSVAIIYWRWTSYHWLRERLYSYLLL